MLMLITPICDLYGEMELIAYSEPCWIHDFWRRRFRFGTRDQAWLLKIFADFIKVWKGKENASDIHVRCVLHLLVLAKRVIYF